jgi:hypothetical protein
MSSNLVINIIGGVCGGSIGTYVSGKIYDYIYNEPQHIVVPQPPSYPPKKYNSKFKDAKSFEEIYRIQLKEQLDNVDIYNYEYDNEHGNAVEIKEKNSTHVNYSLYDNDSTFLTILGRDNN